MKLDITVDMVAMHLEDFERIKHTLIQLDIKGKPLVILSRDLPAVCAAIDLSVAAVRSIQNEEAV